MESYCVRCKKYRKNIVSNTSNGKTMILSKCSKCIKKSRLVKNQEAKRTIKFSLKTPLSKVPLLDNILL